MIIDELQDEIENGVGSKMELGRTGIILTNLFETTSELCLHTCARNEKRQKFGQKHTRSNYMAIIIKRVVNDTQEKLTGSGTIIKPFDPFSSSLFFLFRNIKYCLTLFSSLHPFEVRFVIF